jgi:hypothetical protein
MTSPGDAEGLDIDAIRRVVEEADVFVIRFAAIEHRLLVDARPDHEGRVYIDVVPPVGSAEERYRFLQRKRPSLPLPDQITVFYWPKPTRALRDLGLWEHLEARAEALSGPDGKRQASQALAEAERLERADVAAIIRGGEGYETLWERPRS